MIFVGKGIPIEILTIEIQPDDDETAENEINENLNTLI